MSSKPPLITVLLIDGSFRESFHTLDCLARQTFPRDQFEVIWVEHYATVNPALARTAAQHPNMRAMALGRTGLYHSAYCRNAGVLAATGELIVYMDADVVVEDDFLQQVWEEHQKADDLVMFLYRHDEPRDIHRKDWDLEHLRRVGRITHTLNYGGCISVRKKWLIAINGWEQHPVFGSHFNAHGVDIHARFKSLGLAVKWHPGIRMYHPWHPQSGVSAYAYQLQAAMSTYRMRNLVTLSYDGLDPQRNLALPDELSQTLARLSRQLQRRQSGLPGKTLYVLHEIWHRAAARLKRRNNRMPFPNELTARRE